MCRGKRRAFVEHHLDVGAKQALHLDGALRREQMRCAVDMRLEGHAVLLDTAELRQRHDLIAAGVGKDWPVPAHEAVQPAKLGDALGAGPQHEMIGVGEDDVGAGGAHRLRQHGLDGGRGADRHEGRRADDPARRRDLAEAGAAIARLQGEGKTLSHVTLHRGSIDRHRRKNRSDNARRRRGRKRASSGRGRRRPRPA